MRIANCRFRLKRQRERFLDQLREPRRALRVPSRERASCFHGRIAFMSATPALRFSTSHRQAEDLLVRGRSARRDPGRRAQSRDSGWAGG